MWYLLLLHALFASTFTLGKAALLYVQPIFFVATRLILSGVVLLLIHYCNKGSFKIHRTDMKNFGLLILFQLYLSYVLEFMVLEYVDSTKWALIYTLTPFFTALFSYIILREHLTRLKLVGLIIGLCGVAPVLIMHASPGVSLLVTSFADGMIIISMH